MPSRASEQIAVRGKAQWKDLLGSASGCQNDITMDGVVHEVDAGRMLFIPGNTQHQINNVEDEDLLILYVFAISDFSQVRYHF